ncbi:unnamed protein product [Closterium sp. Yama58-4]|nr:unnamed protein product [Closterium sp. Yama58-4]
MVHRQRTAVEAWVHQLQLEGSNTDGGMSPPAARADKRFDVSATDSASVMVPPTVADAGLRENPKNVAESAQGYESPAARPAAQELPELLERSAEAARFAQLQILSAAEGRSFSAAGRALESGNSPRASQGLQLASSPAVPASPGGTMSFRDAPFPVDNAIAAMSHNVAVTSPSCRTVPLVSSPKSPPGSAAVVPLSIPNRRIGQNFRQPSRFHRQPAALATTKDFKMRDTEGLTRDATCIPTMEVDGDNLNAEMFGMISAGNATAGFGSNTLNESFSTGSHYHGRLSHDTGSHVGGNARFLVGGASSSQVPEMTEWAHSRSGDRDETHLEEFLRGMMGRSSNPHAGTNSDDNAFVPARPDFTISGAPEQGPRHISGLQEKISLNPETPLPSRGGSDSNTTRLVTEPALPDMNPAAQERGPRGHGIGLLNVPSSTSLVIAGSPRVAGPPTAVSDSPNLSGSPLAGSAGLSSSMQRLSGEMALAARSADSRRTMSLPGENYIPATTMLDREEDALVQELLRSNSRGDLTGMGMLVDGGGLDGGGSAAAVGVAASVGGSSDGGDPAPGVSNSSADLAGGTQAQQTGLARQLPDSLATGDWRPRTRTRFDAEAKERGAIKPRSMRERRRRDKISEGLQQLRRTLPAGAVGPQVDTAAMIEVAISHITHLQSQINSLESALLVQSLMEQRANQSQK